MICSTWYNESIRIIVFPSREQKILELFSFIAHSRESEFLSFTNSARIVSFMKRARGRSLFTDSARNIRNTFFIGVNKKYRIFFGVFQSQREISEYKISLQRLEGQSKMALEELEQKDHQLKVVQNRRDEVEREMGKLLGQIEDLEGRQLHKVNMKMCIALY